MDEINIHSHHHSFFREIIGSAMQVYNKYRPGLLESANEAALAYLLTEKGYIVERQVFLPIYWDDVQLNQTYRMDLVVNKNIIIELKAVNYANDEHKRQLRNYMNLTHLPYGMLINFGPKGLFTECYQRRKEDGLIEKIN